MTKPCQFHRAEEVVPLQRTTTYSQENIPGEIWCRSLRADALNVNELGRHNQNVATASVSEMFDRDGLGWTGKTNTRRQGRPRPHNKEWFERPVAVGKMAVDHMGGSRYEIRTGPRECVPGSMSHTGEMTSRSAPGSVPLTAR